MKKYAEDDTKICLESMIKGYQEMAELNLKLSNESHEVENEADIILNEYIKCYKEELI